uniref:Glycine receptor subunit alpha-2-like n=1 Tax=Petromyzon marinus TaxID=7757 RepID=A0AAJ7UIZ3_PETMA|nr:glycine receptor subunit alpha-2-like [Petromyzon marinus]
MESVDILDSLLRTSDYKKTIRPNFAGDPVVVNISIYLKSFSDIQESTMDYRVTLTLWQRWNDDRLRYSSRDFNATDLDESNAAFMWKPDLYFGNEESATVHTVTTPNSMLRIHDNGDVLYSMRLTLTLSCPMDLRTFPMDTQTCPLLITSASYTERDMLLRWRVEQAIVLADDLSIPHFELDPNITLEDCAETYRTGLFPCLKATFTLSRQMGYYVTQVYVPSLLLVMVSWLSFWINKEPAPARVGIGTSTILSMITKSTGSRAMLPKVTYRTAMDVWMDACLIFLIAVLVEYALVQATARRFRDPKVIKNSEESMSDLEERYLRQAVMVDVKARFVFPVAFLAFNAVYWVTCVVGLKSLQ